MDIFEKTRELTVKIAFFLLISCIQTVQSSPVDAAWLELAKGAIRDSELQPTLQNSDHRGKKLSTPQGHLVNKDTNIRIYVDREGWRVVPRVAEADWEVRFSSVSFGRSAKPQVFGSSDFALVENGIQRQHNEELTEWWRNSAKGLEHGFEIRSAPLGDHNVPVCIRSQLTTDLELHVAESDYLSLSLDGHEQFRYEGLKVIDATGAEVPSWLEFAAKSSTLAICFQDTAASYPIVVDPLATTASWKGQADQASSLYAISVATAGDVNRDGFSDVIIGAPEFDEGSTDEGKVFVYYGSKLGLKTVADWTFQINSSCVI